MAHWAPPTIHDAAMIRARSSNHQSFVSLTICTYDRDGEHPAEVSIYMPASCADYAKQIAAAINLIADPAPSEEPAQAESAPVNDLPF